MDAGGDVYALKAEFDIWLADNSARQPDDYQAGLPRLRPALPFSKPLCLIRSRKVFLNRPRADAMS
jgi:hypothetical protein